MGSDGDLARTRLDAIVRSETIGRVGNDEPDEFDDLLPDRSRPDEAGESLSVLERMRTARWDAGRGGGKALAAVAVVAVLVAVVVVWRDRPVPESVPPLPAVEVLATSSRAPVPEPQAEVVVSVVGLVTKPGLVHLHQGARVADALDAAGGAGDGADLLGLNLARRVADGDQIIVGVAPPHPAPEGSAVSGTGGGVAGGDDGGPGQGQNPLNLNTSDEAALDALPGVGPVTAAAIVAWRRDNGPFTDVEQLSEVDGIGPARLARLRELVAV
ncbi:ComEA family DNA-binding protein [Rhodococcus sp. SJ-3]|uniref:ComEA family DNA-binding protein n=1 Tax=Rhodococcus sp. SJ-3 TaxID=3454628 RepID=UPI003F79D57E